MNRLFSRARTLGFRLKLGLIAAALVIASLAVVLAFAAGFLIGAWTVAADGKDACAAAGGTWDSETRLCMQSAPQTGPASESLTYACGDGSELVVTELDEDRIRYQEGSITRELVKEDPAGNIAVYRDGSLRLSTVSIEARLTDADTGRDVACTLR